MTNALLSFWGLSEQAGAIRLSADQPILISARTYNDANPAGTYGLALDPVRVEDLLIPGDTAHAAWVSHSTDPSRAYRTNIAAVLVLPDSAVDVVLFDAAGAELGRTSFSGKPGLYQVSTGALTPADVPIGRAEFQVRAGKATGYTAVVDNVTGDAIAVQSSLGVSAAVDVAVNGVAHAPGREGTYFVTDVRLFNISREPNTATVSLLGVSVPGQPSSIRVTLAPREVKEILDVLGTSFQAPDGTAGALRVQAAGPLTVLARTSNVKRDGSPGTFGAAQLGRPLDSFTAVGSSAVLIGLRQSSDRPGYRSNVGFLAGETGGKARATLRDTAGQLVATNELAVDLPAFGWTQPAVASLFPDAAIPADARLEIETNAGSLDTYASVIDNGTGDSVVNPGQPIPTAACGDPRILSLGAFPNVIGEAGTVTLAPGGSGLPAPGTLTLNVAGPTTVRLTATGPCGTATATTTIGFGSPGPPALSVSSASPGQLLTLTPSNLADASLVTGVSFTFPGNIEVVSPVKGVSTAGEIRVFVPYAPVARASRYLTGAATVSLRVQGLGKSAPAPFTVTPLSFTGDPSGAFKAWLEAYVGAVRASLQNQRQATGAAGFVDTLAAAVDPYAALLQKMADDIASSGTATVPFDLPSSRTPAPDTTAVTRADLADFMALLANVSSASPPTSAPLAGPCIASDPLVAYCKFSRDVDPNGVVKNLLGVLGLGANGVDLDTCLFSLAQSGLGAALGNLGKLAALNEALCQILPVALTEFRIAYTRIGTAPEAPPIPLGDKAYGTLNALLKSSSPKDAIAQPIIQLATSRLDGNVKEFSTKCPGAFAGVVGGLVGKVFDRFKDIIADAVGRIIGNFALSRLVPVGACDLPVVRPGNPKLFEKLKDGDPYYYELRGLREGRSALLVFPNPASFIYPPDFPEAMKSGPFKVPVVIATPPSARTSSVGGGGGGTTNPGGQCSFRGQNGEVTEESPVDYSFVCDSYPGLGRLRATQEGPGKWQVVHSMCGGPISGNEILVQGYISMSLMFDLTIRQQPPKKGPEGTPRVTVTRSGSGRTLGRSDSVMKHSFYAQQQTPPYVGYSMFDLAQNPFQTGAAFEFYGTKGNVDVTVSTTLDASSIVPDRNATAFFSASETMTVDIHDR